MDHIILSDNTYYSFAENIYMAIIHESPKYKTYNEVMLRIEKDKKMLLKNKSIDEIVELTEFTIKEIEPIKEKFDNLISLIKDMITTNMDVRNIAKYTGISVEYVNKIKEDMENKIEQ